MTPQQFIDNLNLQTKELNTYARDQFPQMAINKVQRFIDGNFRAQGWQGALYPFFLIFRRESGSKNETPSSKAIT